ncbi:hypothetical protein hrd7_34310 (plasmid) [Leptolinea sp. HRD-7]|nr:hypothetical protein hrd7_34310 [Leptolinea sp. HRD-7]
MAYVRLYEVMNRLFNKENALALALALMLIALLVFTAESTPLWIYQGF